MEFVDKSKGDAFYDLKNYHEGKVEKELIKVG